MDGLNLQVLQSRHFAENEIPVLAASNNHKWRRCSRLEDEASLPPKEVEVARNIKNDQKKGPEKVWKKRNKTFTLKGSHICASCLMERRKKYLCSVKIGYTSYKNLSWSCLPLIRILFTAEFLDFYVTLWIYAQPLLLAEQNLSRLEKNCSFLINTQNPSFQKTHFMWIHKSKPEIICRMVCNIYRYSE